MAETKENAIFVRTVKTLIAHISRSTNRLVLRPVSIESQLSWLSMEWLAQLLRDFRALGLHFFVCNLGKFGTKIMSLGQLGDRLLIKRKNTHLWWFIKKLHKIFKNKFNRHLVEKGKVTISSTVPTALVWCIYLGNKLCFCFSGIVVVIRMLTVLSLVTSYLSHIVGVVTALVALIGCYKLSSGGEPRAKEHRRKVKTHQDYCQL